MNLPEIKTRAEELFAQGLSEAEVADEMDLPLRGVQRVLTDFKRQIQKRRVLPLREAGDTYAQISKKTGLSTRTIWQILSKAGEVESRGPKKIDPSQKREIKYRIFIGEHHADVAEDYGISVSYVYQIASGVGTDGRSLDGDTCLAIAKDFLVEGMPTNAIALRRGVSINTVYNHRFADPMIEVEWFMKHELEYASAKRFSFDDPGVPMSVYWAVWFAYHREKQTYEALAERMGLSLNKVMDIAGIRTESAYRAAWELRVKERGYE